MGELWSLWPDAGWQRFAIDAAWQGTLVSAVALAVARATRRRPALRAAVALAAASLCVATPTASSLARWGGWGLLTPSADVGGANDLVVRESPTRMTWPAPEGARVDRLHRVAPAAVDSPHDRAIAAWAWRVFVVAWIAMSTVLSLRLARSALALRRACREASPCLDPDIQSALARAVATLGVRAPELLTCAAVDSPALVAWGRPRVLLPAGGGPRNDWYAIFCHELAHFARRDGWGRLALESCVIVLPWQPFVWLLRRDFRAACEEACDDWAVSAGVDPVDFAALLLDFVPQARSALVLGMSESVSAARSRIVRLLAMQGVPRPRLGRLLGLGGWLVAGVLAVAIALLQYGRLPWAAGTDLPPWGNAPISTATAGNVAQRPTLGPYRVEPPDILLIDAVKIVPKSPYHIEPLDELSISVLGGLPDQPIDGRFTVDPGGTVQLGPAYGSAQVGGMTLDEATTAIHSHLANVLVNPELSVSLAESAGQQQIAGHHLVGPDGTVTLGVYGSVPVAGMTLAEVRKAVEAHLERFLDNPKVSVDVYAYNSQVYYVIVENRYSGDQISRVPFTGNETVLDALSQLNPSVQLTADSWVWIARPASQDGTTPAEVLPVDWRALLRGESNATNYWRLPGDRVFISGGTRVAQPPINELPRAPNIAPGNHYDQPSPSKRY